MKRMLSILLSTLLLVGLGYTEQVGATTAVRLVFLAINDTLPPELINSVTTFGGSVYVPYSVFAGYGLGLTASYFPSAATAYVASGEQQLYFEISTGDTYDEEGTHYVNPGIAISGSVYLPLNLIAEHFGTIRYVSLAGNEYGSILRITTDDAQLTDEEFLQSARSAMQMYYNAYNTPAFTEPPVTIPPTVAPPPVTVPPTVAPTPTPTQTPRPAVTSTPTPRPTATFRPTATPTQTRVPSTSPEPSPTISPGSTPLTEPSSPVEPSPRPTGDSPEPTSSVQPVSTPEPFPHAGERLTLSFIGLPGERILNILNQYRIKSCFFLTADDVRADPGLVRRVVGEGHSFGVYCQENPAETFPLTAALLFEAAHVRTILLACPSQYVDACQAFAEEQGLVWCGYTLTAATQDGEGAVSPEDVTALLDADAGDRALRLDCDETTIQALGRILNYLKLQRYVVAAPRETDET